MKRALILAVLLIAGVAQAGYLGFPDAMGGGGSGATTLTGLTDVSAKSGNGTVVPMTTGTLTNAECLEADATGNVVSSGAACAAAGLANVVEDVTPQLGAALDAQTFDLTNVGNTETACLDQDGDGNCEYKSDGSTVGIDYDDDDDTNPDVVFGPGGLAAGNVIEFDAVVDISQEADPCLALREAMCDCADTSKTSDYAVLLKGAGTYDFADVDTAAAAAWNDDLNECLVFSPNLGGADGSGGADGCNASGYPDTFESGDDNNVYPNDWTTGADTQCVVVKDPSYRLTFDATGQTEPVLSERWGAHNILGTLTAGDQEQGQIRDNGLVLIDLGGVVDQVDAVETSGWRTGRPSGIGSTAGASTWIGQLFDHIKNTDLSRAIGNVNCDGDRSGSADTDDDIGIVFQQVWTHGSVGTSARIQSCGVGVKTYARFQSIWEGNLRANDIGFIDGDEDDPINLVYAGTCPLQGASYNCTADANDATFGGVIRGIFEESGVAGVVLHNSTRATLEDLYLGTATGANEVLLMVGNGWDPDGRPCAIDDHHEIGSVCGAADNLACDCTATGSTNLPSLIRANRVHFDQSENDDILNTALMLGPEAVYTDPDPSWNLLKFENSELATLCDATTDTDNCSVYRRSGPTNNMWVDVTGSSLLAHGCVDTTPADGECDSNTRFADPIVGRVLYDDPYVITSGQPYTYDVTYFGADAVDDGITDDTLAIEAAAHAAGLAGGGTAYLPCGTYETGRHPSSGADFSGIHIYDDNVTLRGDGRCSTIIPHDSVTVGYHAIEVTSDFGSTNTFQRTTQFVLEAEASSTTTRILCADCFPGNAVGLLDLTTNEFYVEVMSGAAIDEGPKLITGFGNTGGTADDGDYVDITGDTWSTAPGVGDTFIVHPRKLSGITIRDLHFYDDDPTAHGDTGGGEETHGITSNAAELLIDRVWMTDLGDEGVDLKGFNDVTVSNSNFRGIPQADPSGGAISALLHSNTKLLNNNIWTRAFTAGSASGIALWGNYALDGLKGSTLVQGNNILHDPEASIGAGTGIAISGNIIGDFLIESNTVDNDHRDGATDAYTIEFSDLSLNTPGHGRIINNHLKGLASLQTFTGRSTWDFDGNWFWSDSPDQTNEWVIITQGGDGVSFRNGKIGPYSQGAIRILGSNGSGGKVSIVGVDIHDVFGDGTNDQVVEMNDSDCGSTGSGTTSLTFNHNDVRIDPAGGGNFVIRNCYHPTSNYHFEAIGNTIDTRNTGDTAGTIVGEIIEGCGVISDNTIRRHKGGTNQWAIRLANSCVGGVVTGNRLLDIVTPGIGMSTSDRAVVTGNFISAESGSNACIQLISAEQSIVSNNTFEGCPAGGAIDEQTGSQNNVVTGNISDSGPIQVGDPAEGLGGYEGCTDSGLTTNGSICGLNIDL